MSKGKLAKFADMEALPNVFQFPYSWFLSNQRVGDSADSLPKGGQEFVCHPLSGAWHSEVFHNQNPIVLELGCGKGEYTVGLAKMFPEMNFIGVDIKGSRMWTGAMQAHREGMENVAFLRTNIEIIDRFFREDEVQEASDSPRHTSWSATAISSATEASYTSRPTPDFSIPTPALWRRPTICLSSSIRIICMLTLVKPFLTPRKTSRTFQLSTPNSSPSRPTTSRCG